MSTEWGDNIDLTYFGKTNFRSTDRVFGIKRKDRRQHMYVLGKSGTGKSVLLSNMIIQNIKNGEGVCVIDPHGELVQEILASIPPERVNDTIYFNPGDIDYHVGFNVLELEDVNYKHLVASGIMGIFTKIWANAWSSRMEYILNNAILALLDTPGSTLLGIPRLLVDKDYRQTIITNLKDPVVRAFWVHEYEAWRDQFRNEAIAPIQNKVGQFLSTAIVRNVVGQSKSTIDIFNIMNSGKIFLVNVSKGRVGEDNSALLGGMLITKIQLAAMERVRIPEDQRKDFYLYVDEFQNFVTDSFANILSEARKYRLNLTIAHQYIGQLETESGAQVRDAVFGNVGTMIVFRVGATDADFLEKEFEPEFEPQDFVNLPNYHIYLKLMVDGIASRPFSATTLPPIKVEHSEEIVKKVVETSRRLYMRPRKEVEDEITRWSSATGGKIEQNSMDGGRSPMSQGQTEGGRFDAKCSSCEKDIKVPFEPQAGRPVYCRDCLEKIKAGELQPVIVSGPKTKKMEAQSSDVLASLGIEFTPEGVVSDVSKVEKYHDEKNAINKKVDTKKEFKVGQEIALNKNKPQTTFTPRSPQPNRPGPQSQKPPISGPQKPKNDISELKSSLQSALSNIGLDGDEKKPKAILDSVTPVHFPVSNKSIPLSSLSNNSIQKKQVFNSKAPTEKNLSALKDILAVAMSEKESLVEKKEEKKTFAHHEARKELEDVDRLHQAFSNRKDGVSEDDQIKKQEEEKKRLEIEQKEKEEREQKRLEEERLMKEKMEVERKAREEESKRQAEIEARKKQEEARIAEERRKVEEERKQREVEEARKREAEEKARQEAQIAEQKRKEEEARMEKEREEKRKAEEAERLKREEEEAIRIVREKERQLAEEEARIKQEEFQKKSDEAQSSQSNTQQQTTQSYTPRQPISEVPEDVLKKILE